jgi:hypothetical protein
LNGWREIIAGTAGDRDSGSRAITRRAAEGLALAAGEGEAALRRAIDQLLQGQPSMAALRNLADDVAWAAQAAGREAAARVARAFVARGPYTTLWRSPVQWVGVDQAWACQPHGAVLPKKALTGFAIGL